MRPPPHWSLYSQCCWLLFSSKMSDHYLSKTSLSRFPYLRLFFLVPLLASFSPACLLSTGGSSSSVYPCDFTPLFNSPWEISSTGSALIVINKLKSPNLSLELQTHTANDFLKNFNGHPMGDLNATHSK